MSAATPPTPRDSGRHHHLLSPAVLLSLHPLGFHLRPSPRSGSPFLLTLQTWAFPRGKSVEVDNSSDGLLHGHLLNLSVIPSVLLNRALL